LSSRFQSLLAAAATVIVAAACTSGSDPATRSLITGAGARFELAWASHWEEDPSAKMLDDVVSFRSTPLPPDMLVLMSVDLEAGFKPATSERMRARLGELVDMQLRTSGGRVGISAIRDGSHPGFFIQYDDHSRMRHTRVLVMSVHNRMVEAHISSTDQGAAEAERARRAIVNLRLELP
jgi:hypothetical protein